MSDFEKLQEALKNYDSLAGGCAFFQALGYPVMTPLAQDLDNLPEGARAVVSSVVQLVHLEGASTFRIYHVALAGQTLRRTDIRRFLEAFYRRFPQGENLFVFSAGGSYEELAFVSPRRVLDLRNPEKVRLWLRTLQVQRKRAYRTDLEVLSRIRANGLKDPQEIWKCHEEAFSVQRVTEQFFQDYREIFLLIQGRLAKTHPQHGPEWTRDYAHQLLNRIMFLYFIARKGWLLGPDNQPNRDFMRHFWEAYQESVRTDASKRDTFHREWLDVLFFEAFNNRWQNRHEYLQRFPEWIVKSLAQTPFLNGGLYSRYRGLDDALVQPLPDEVFELLFARWTDNTFPGFFERYNFTVVESGRFEEEVAVDPEMLGMVYERLVNVTFEAGHESEDLRGAAGIFYTPRTEIDLMCRLALVDWLSHHVGRAPRHLLYRWVFALSEEEKREADEAVTQHGLWKQLDQLVKQVRVCDPACGSGSFLVGMLLVLDDLQARCNQVLGQSETPYERRKRILQDQLYGVDVMEWAVRVAELRLWLQLVVETQLQGWELKARPLLPNLSFKLRPGDSLLQTLGDLDLSPFRRTELPLPASLKGRLTQLKGKKRRFFQGEDPTLSEALLKQKEQNLFRDILQAKIDELDNQLKRKRRESAARQGAFPGMEDPRREEEARRRQEEELQALQQQKQRLHRALEALRPDLPPPFVWDLAFVEIFEDENPGFDIVIGNPPYVRQEKIRDYLKRFDRTTYLERLNDSLRALYPAFMGKNRRISGRADYYVYFYLHALSLLADRGAFCFITSNSWLDVDFGRDLQEFFLRYGRLKMVIDNRARRSFAQADVNTVIVLAGPPERKRTLTQEEMQQRPVRFVAFRVPFERVMPPGVFADMEDESGYQPLAGFRVLSRPEFRSILHDQWSLYQAGLGEDEEGRLVEARRYAGDKWGGKYLRAPDIFFTILEKGKGKLVRLGDIAEVRRGFTTGANEFFYLEPVRRSVKEVAELREKDPKAPVRVKNGAGWEGEIEAAWLRPVIKSPREIRTLRVRLEDLRYLIFMPPEDVRQAIERGNKEPWRGYPLAAAYIRWGESQGYPERPTCASRPWWWDVGKREPADFLWPIIHNDRAALAVHEPQICVDHNLFEISSACQEALAGSMSATYQALVKELLGRVNLGEGAIKTEGVDIARLLVVNPLPLLESVRDVFISAFDRLSRRPIRSIFEELGFGLCRAKKCEHPEHPYEQVRPEALTLEQVRQASPDRFALDSVVFDVLGLTDAERLQVYQAVAQLVKDRLVKAKSV